MLVLQVAAEDRLVIVRDTSGYVTRHYLTPRLALATVLNQHAGGERRKSIGRQEEIRALRSQILYLEALEEGKTP